MAADYRVVQIPLDAVVARRVLVQPGIPVTSLGVLRVPAGTSDTADLHFSEGGDAVPIVSVLQSLSRSPAATDGVYYSVRAAAAPGTIALVLIGLGVSLEGQGTQLLEEIRDYLYEIRNALTGKG
jgi:hypothetical protein